MNIECELLNEYFNNSSDVVDFNEIEYLLLTTDKYNNLRYNSYRQVVLSLIEICLGTFCNESIKKYIISKMELNNGNYKYALKNPFNDLSKALYNLRTCCMGANL